MNEINAYYGGQGICWVEKPIKRSGLRSLVCEDITLESAKEKQQVLGRFLKSVERRALRIAEIALGDREEALDVLQDAMMKLVQSYAHKSEDEWTPLFYRILQNKIRDHQRKKAVRSKVQGWFGMGRNRDEEEAVMGPEDYQDEAARTPEQQMVQVTSIEALEQALDILPARQQQAFLLRVWEGLDVKQTAQAMSISEGSVKTHFSRAVHSLRETLGEYWP